MPRILGVDLPKEKRIDVALRYLYGIGPKVSAMLLKSAQIDPARRAKDLNEEEVAKISTAIQKAGMSFEGDLRREISANVKRLMDIGAYRGSRHKKGLPVRGQRTRTNARGRKGPRRNVAATRKVAA